MNKGYMPMSGRYPLHRMRWSASCDAAQTRYTPGLASAAQRPRVTTAATVQ